MIVVTGATGHLGNVVVRTLLERGLPVRALVRTSDPAALAGVGVERVHADLLDRASLERAFSGARWVIHAASLISTIDSDRAVLERINIEGTRNVVDACLAAKVERLVYVSSVEATDLRGGRITLTTGGEFEATTPIMVYGATKARATLTVLDAVRRRGLDAVIVVPSGFIGPFDFRPSLTGELISRFLERRLPAYIEGSFDFVDVRDVALGAIAAAERGRTGHAYLLTGTQVSLPGLMELLGELSGVPKPVAKVPLPLAYAYAFFMEIAARITHSRPLYTRNSIRILRSRAVFDPSATVRELGVRARPLRETLSDTIAWFEEHPSRRAKRRTGSPRGAPSDSRRTRVGTSGGSSARAGKDSQT